MTVDEFTKQLPILTNNPLPIKPPFVFNGMSVRVFPLRASLDSLQQLCDGYLNFVPPEAGRFRALAPYVFLMVLDYGQVAEAVTRIGWFAQLEVFFSVPVEWYKLVNGKWVFHDWAVITPYVFVNDNFSVPLGRTVYGFPKILAQVTPATSEWIQDPLAPVTLARVETAVFPEAYAGAGLENKVFLEIERDAPMSNFQVPPDPLSPMMPWMIASNLAQAMGGFGRDLMWLSQAMRIFPTNPFSNPLIIPEMLSRIAPSFAPAGTGFVQNSLNLKQFRRADDPSRICYQSLTNGRMITTGFNGGGLLGEERTFLGDLSGGHTVKLYEHASLPIARVLGLEIDRQLNLDGDLSVAEIKPVMPFWMDMNLIYDQGDNLAWRTHDGKWKDGTGAPLSTEGVPDTDAESLEFNSTVASSIEAISGPFQFAGTTTRVLPLLAKRDSMQAFLDEFINQALDAPIHREDGQGEEKVRLSVWARPPAQVNSGDPIGGDMAYVYLTASSFTSISSKSNNVGDWAKYEVDFMIPVKWERLAADGTTWNVEGVGMVPAFSLEDNCIAAISRFEVQGIDARTANFVRPESVWLKEGEAQVDSQQTLLRVDAEVWSAYGAGQKATVQPVIEISQRDADVGLGAGSVDTPFVWAESLRQELGAKKGTKAKYPADCKIARALALELLGNHTPFSLYTLKQFRDVNDPDKACYQELVRVPRVLHELFDIREIEETLVVRIHDYPSLKIAETLGIVGTTIPDSGAGIVYSAQAVRPFYVCATVDEPLAERLLARAGSSHWTLFKEAFQSLLSEDEGSPGIAADRQAEQLQDQMNPCRMTAIMYNASQRLKDAERNPASTSATAISKAQAREALDKVDPQMVIDSVLSREWGNADPNARWRRGRQSLLDLFTTLPSGGAVQAFVESALYRKVNNFMASRPGAVASLVAPVELLPGERGSNPAIPWNVRWQSSLEEILENQQQFTQYRLKLENSFTVLSSYEVLGMQGLQYASQQLVGQPAPSGDELKKAANDLLDALTGINTLSVKGEPSERNHLDTQVAADKSRLGELLGALDAKIHTPAGPGVEPPAWGSVDLAELCRQVVELARKFCTAQREALLNKLSRAYQKPDFCLRRDAAGADRDRLLPASLSWDDDWYYGIIIKAEDVGGDLA